MIVGKNKECRMTGNNSGTYIKCTACLHIG